jgi:hypothetical protein
MNQAQLERAVCRATGESRDVVRRVGFQFVPMPKVVYLPRNTPVKRMRLNTFAGPGK